MAMPVEYKAKRLARESRQLLNGPITRETARRLLTTKYSHWRYEQEVRVFVSLEDKDKDSEGRYFAEFSPDLKLVAVIVGARSEISRGQISEKLGSISSQVDVFKARLAFRSFQIVRNKNESLWI
jgi:DNA-directed RNA polymerase sigma subunit (sigma70/sigma32)